MKKRVYSGIDKLPSGSAPDTIVNGCLALEGGAFRGVYTSGVLDALMEAGINMQTTVGVSAGAMNAVSYVSAQIGRAGRINLGYRHDRRYVGPGVMRRNRGIIGFDFVFGGICDEVPFDSERFEDPRRRFVAVATDLRTGEPCCFEKGSCDIFAAVRASASMPYVSKPVMIDGVPYLDGGCSVKIPYAWAIAEGFEKIVVVKTRQDGYRRADKSDGMARRFYGGKYPKFAGVLETSNRRSNEELDELDELAKSGRVFLIRPSQPVTVGRLERDMEKLGALYHLGYDDAKRMLPDLRRYLGI